MSVAPIGSVSSDSSSGAVAAARATPPPLTIAQVPPTEAQRDQQKLHADAEAHAPQSTLKADQAVIDADRLRAAASGSSLSSYL